MRPRRNAAIVRADADSRTRYGGHGSAMAQVYNHAIMPLANARDREAQVYWGLCDFRQRFGRDPEGMWLAETAVDTPTLEALAAHGITFTVLAPYQAAAVRPIVAAGGTTLPWADVTGGRIDPTMPYLCRLPSGRTINLFFYDGPVSRAVAFEGLLSDGVRFAERICSVFTSNRTHPQLMHIATDGESYGHHHRFGDMALTSALNHIESLGLARLTNYGEFLSLFPPTHEVQIVERTAWSCSHGVGRWARDCGCSSGGHPEWNQRWRAPLRRALDWLRDTCAPLFEFRGREVFRDPWAARMGYISVVLDRNPENVDRFLDAHAAHPLTPTERVTALKLLELQRNAMLMYTSCGWFFDEISGIETVQILQYAARCLQLARELFGLPSEDQLCEILEQAQSNVTDYGTGADVYRRFAARESVELPDVAAHYAVSALFRAWGSPATVPAFAAELSPDLDRTGHGAHLVAGRATITSTITRESARLEFAVVHSGDLDVTCGVGPAVDSGPNQSFLDIISAAFDGGDPASVAEAVRVRFPGRVYSLDSIFRDERRNILNAVLETTIDDVTEVYRQAYERQAPLMNKLAVLRIPLPPVLRATAEFALNDELERSLVSDAVDPAHVRAMLDEAKRWEVVLVPESLEYALRSLVERQAARL